jgi:hypothetical protein
MRLKMRKIFSYNLAVVLLSVCSATAQTAQNPVVPTAPDEKQTLPQLKGLAVPDSPTLGADGKPLNIADDIAAPRGEILGYLANSPISNIEQLNHQEHQPTQFYWHTSPGGDFCHYRDFEGNHWYGWMDRGRFHWVLYKADRFWWNDSYAGRWLYLDRGQWWWKDEPSPNRVRLYLDGSYYPCNAKGVIVSADLGERPGEIVSGSGPFQGDLTPAGGQGSSRGRGGHHGEGHEGGHRQGVNGEGRGGHQGNPTGN